MRAWTIVLISAAGLGLAAEEALADRGRQGRSSASRPHHDSRPQHHSTPQHRHGRPQHHHHHYHARPHHHHGWWWPGLVIAPAFAAEYYYAAPPVYAAPPPPMIPSLNDGYWYFCRDNGLYYPYAVECPSGWQQVMPR